MLARSSTMTSIGSPSAPPQVSTTVQPCTAAASPVAVVWPKSIAGIIDTNQYLTYCTTRMLVLAATNNALSLSICADAE